MPQLLILGITNQLTVEASLGREGVNWSGVQRIAHVVHLAGSEPQPRQSQVTRFGRGSCAAVPEVPLVAQRPCQHVAGGDEGR